MDWQAHCVDLDADHPVGLWIARCGRRLPARVGLHEQPPGHRCMSCARWSERAMSLQHPGETYRHAIDGRRPIGYGGGACTVLVRAVDGTVQVLFHADLRTAAVLTEAQIGELTDALTAARRAAT